MSELLGMKLELRIWVRLTHHLAFLRLRRLHPSWKFAVSPSGEYLAMLDETKLTIFSRDKWSCRESTWTGNYNFFIQRKLPNSLLSHVCYEGRNFLC